MENNLQKRHAKSMTASRERSPKRQEDCSKKKRGVLRGSRLSTASGGSATTTSFLLPSSLILSLSTFFFVLNMASGVDSQRTSYQGASACVLTTLPLAGVKICENGRGVSGTTNVWCEVLNKTSCHLTEPECSIAFEAYVPTPTPSVIPVPTGVPMSSATPLVQVRICNATNKSPGNCTSSCQTGYCGTCLINNDCPLRSTDQFGNINETGNILAYGFINDDCGSDDPSIDDQWRPKCGCNMYDMNYHYIGGATKVVDSGNEWAVYPYTLCYPPFKGPNECFYANSGPCVSFRVQNGTTFWVPYFAPQDPVFCSDLDGNIDVTCQRSFEKGLPVNGPVSFCSEFPCDTESSCNCSYGFVRKNCTINGKEVFKMTLKSLHTGFTSERVIMPPPIPFSVDDTTCHLKITGSEPIMMDTGFSKNYLLQGTHDLCQFEGREITLTHKDTTRIVEIPRRAPIEEKTRNILWIVFVILSITLASGLFLLISVFAAMYLYNMRITRRLSRSLSAFMREFKPERALFFMLIITVGAVKTSYNSTHDCYVRAGCTQGTLDLCGNLKTFNEIICFDRPTYSCKAMGTCNGEEEIFHYTDVTQCEVRSGFPGIWDTLGCSTLLGSTVVILIVLVLILMCLVLTPSAWATTLLLISLVPRVNSCSVSQTIQSGAQSCVTVSGSTTCSYSTTLDFSIELGQTFCADFTNSYGQVNQAIQVEFTGSDTYALEKSLFYTSSFETHPTVRFSCNDCLLSCSGDCSKESCDLANGGLNPNGQINSATNWCTGVSGCELTDDGFCLFGDNCQWWQASICPEGVTSLVREITGSSSVQSLKINGLPFSSSQSQPAVVGEFLVSTSSAQDPVNFASLGLKTRLTGLSTACGFLPTNNPTAGALGDFRCKTQNCTESVSTATFPQELCSFLGSDTIQCQESFIRNVRSQSQCYALPTVKDGVSLGETPDGRLKITQVNPAKVRVLLTLQGFNVSYNNEISTVKIKEVKCSGISNQTSGVEIVAKVDCSPPGRVMVSLNSEDTMTGQNSALCVNNVTVRATSNSGKSSGILTIGSRIQNDSMSFSCELSSFIGKVDKQNVTVETVAETQVSGLWGRIFDGEGSFLDWFWAFLQILVLVGLLALILFGVWMCLPVLMEGCLFMKSLRGKINWKSASKKAKDPEVPKPRKNVEPTPKQAEALRRLSTQLY